MKVTVFGSRGQLGAAVVHEFGAAHNVTAFDRLAVDLRDEGRVADALSTANPDVIINCTGYNAVDAAEDAPVDALQVNSFAVRTLAREARERGCRLVHYGSDFIFDGTASTPYTEDAAPNPRSAYACSKLIGEWFAADAPGAYVLRVESLFGRAPAGPPAKGSVEAIVKKLRAGETCTVFSDRVVTPTYVVDAAVATRELLERSAPPGTYHCVNSGSCTWEELALDAARLLGVEPHLDVVTLASVKLKAERPKYCALSNAKLSAAAYPMPTWQSALGRYLRGKQS